MSSGSHGYRPDIDGLRALAVVSVCVFHAFPALLPGGFVGVDVFFVISGFLITSILQKDLQEGRFSLATFYARRVRRIFPSLLITLALVLALGWYVCLDDEYQQVGKHVLASASFTSNLLYYLESGYFDVVAERKPLLNLWSLAVEEQFYIVWPLLLFAVRRRQLSFVAWISALTVLSLLASELLVWLKPAASFFMPFSRFWELAAGGLTAYGLSRGSWRLSGAGASVLALAGLALVVSSCLWMDRNFAFPGVWAIPPVAGAILLIVSAESPINRHLMSSPPLVWIGLISYPLYLLHWPLLTFVRIVTPSPTAIEILGCLALALAMSYLLYRAVETPVRRRGAWLAVAVCVASLAAFALVGGAIHAGRGLPGRAVVAMNRTLASGHDGGEAGIPVGRDCGPLGPHPSSADLGCVVDLRDLPRFVLIGDSKAMALVAGLMRTSSPGMRWAYVGGTASDGAPSAPVLSDHEIYARHRDATADIVDYVSSRPHVEVVAIAMATRTLFDLRTDRTLAGLPDSPHAEMAHVGLGTTVRRLVEAGKKVVLVIDNPTLPHPHTCLERRTAIDGLNELLSVEEKNGPCRIAIDEHLALSAQYRHVLERIAGTHGVDKVGIFDTVPVLCEAQRGACYSIREGRMLYGNTDHVSDFAAGLIGFELNRFVGRSAYAGP